MSERLPLSRTQAALRARLNQELLDEYKQVSPTRAYFLEGPPPTKLTKASCAVFQLRTESAKTKDWRWRHNQPLDDEPFNRTCRLCKGTQETVIHLVQQCPSTEARQARRILKSYYTRAKQDVPVGQHEILRRYEDADIRKFQDEGARGIRFPACRTVEFDEISTCRGATGILTADLSSSGESSEVPVF